LPRRVVFYGIGDLDTCKACGVVLPDGDERTGTGGRAQQQDNGVDARLAARGASRARAASSPFKAQLRIQQF
jgi:hypothetical protein